MERRRPWLALIMSLIAAYIVMRLTGIRPTVRGVDVVGAAVVAAAIAYLLLGRLSRSD